MKNQRRLKFLTRTRENFDIDWMFYRGELGFIPKTVQKSGMIAGVTNVLGGNELGDPFPNYNLIKSMLSFATTSSEEDTSHYILSLMLPKAPDDKETGWMPVNLPHDWRVEQEYSDDKRLCMQGFLPGGIGYYRKVFKIPKSDEGKKIIIEFDGVMRNCSTWLNGCFLGDHIGGYTSFYYDITDLLKYGDDEGDNVILVRTDTLGGDEGWWYEGGGIYRHVFLCKYDRLHVDQWGVFVYTEKIEDKKASLRAQITSFNEYTETKEYAVRFSIINPRQKTVVTDIKQCSAASLEKTTEKLNFILDKPMLWTTETPWLYKAVTEIIFEGNVVDRNEMIFGIRTIEYKSSGLFLNGNHIVIKGTCNHQDFAGVGVALPDSVQEYKIKKLKELGCNAYRSAHNPATPELLNVCDRLGMLVMEENRTPESTDNKLKDLEMLIRRDRNHPSIFMWSLGNEEFIGGSVQATRMLRRFASLAHVLDPSRPVTSPEIPQLLLNPDYFNILDVVGLNYGEATYNQQSLEGNKIKYPDKKFINTENVSFFSTRGVYEDNEGKAYCSNFGSQYSIMGSSMQGGTSTPENSWNTYLRNTYTGGLFVWTGFDYRGEPMPFTFTGIASQFGIMDICGFPKDYYFYYKSIWNHEPVVHIMPHWTWPEKLGQLITVRVFTNCEEIELILNGKSIGKRNKFSDWIEWEINYVPGKLEAIGYINGTAVEKDIQETAGEPAEIALETDKSVLSNREVAFITVSARDAQGRVVPEAMNKIVFDVFGSGFLLGVGNGDPGSREQDKSDTRRLFNGYCLALLQSSGKEGNILIKASSESLKSCEIEIETKL